MSETVGRSEVRPFTVGGADLPSLVESSTEQIERLDADVRSFVPEPDRRGRLLAEAEKLGDRFPDPRSRPSFFGLMVGVKDIFHVEGLPTRAGSSLPPEALFGEEGWAVKRLRQAGALILGKTVTTEFAYFSPGPTRNPHNLAHTPGGSSSGSAAAVALGLCPLSLGTQTIGSVIRPAAFCGVFGLKPSFGRIPVSGVIPLSPSLDQVGFFARDPRLVELAAEVLVRGWNPSAFDRRPRLGVPEGPYLDQVTEEGLKNISENLSLLEDAGCEVIRIPAFIGFSEIVERHYLIVAGEAASVHRTWFSVYADRYHPKTRELIERGSQVRQEELVQARSQRAVLRKDLGDLMETHGIDVWVTPAAPGTAPAGLESTGDPVMNLPWTQAGMPAFNLPSGSSPDRLPFGLQVVGRFGEDEKLLACVRQMAKILKPDV